MLYTGKMAKVYKSSGKDELMDLIEKDVPLGQIDIALITDMSNLFEFSKRKDFQASKMGYIPCDRYEPYVQHGMGFQSALGEMGRIKCY